MSHACMVRGEPCMAGFNAIRCDWHAVSEVHAELCWNGSSWVLRDSESSNGTAVNGRKLQPKVEWAELKEGDEVLFGLESKGTIKVGAEGRQQDPGTWTGGMREPSKITWFLHRTAAHPPPPPS